MMRRRWTLFNVHVFIINLFIGIVLISLLIFCLIPMRSCSVTALQCESVAIGHGMYRVGIKRDQSSALPDCTRPPMTFMEGMSAGSNLASTNKLRQCGRKCILNSTASIIGLKDRNQPRKVGGM